MKAIPVTDQRRARLGLLRSRAEEAHRRPARPADHLYHGDMSMIV
jgi:hypothetical protein